MVLMDLWWLNQISYGKGIFKYTCVDFIQGYNNSRYGGINSYLKRINRVNLLEVKKMACINFIKTINYGKNLNI